jgi:aspartyl-tRNA(Asn)/glutamyl-tRNA(Gln) amidotransferase subunit C
MMISKEEVEYTARLARLQLSPEAIVKNPAELSSILDYIEQLKRVDTSGIDSTAHYASNEKTTKEGRMGASLTVDDALAKALAGFNNTFSVPKVIDN